SSSTQSSASRVVSASAGQPIKRSSHGGVRKVLAASEVANPRSTVVQPDQAGARLISVPQISGTLEGSAINPPNCSIKLNSPIFQVLNASADAITSSPNRKVTI